MRSFALGAALPCLIILGCSRPAPRSETSALPSTPPPHPEARVDGRVAMVIAHNDFRDEELLKPKEQFEAAGLVVDVVSSSMAPANGMLGAKVAPGKLLGEVRAEDFRAVVFVGGSGASEYFDDEVAHSLCRATVAKGAVLGAICLAPVTLARAGVLDGKNATVWPDNRPDLESVGVLLADRPVHVVTDGNIVTADGPDAADEFAKAVLDRLKAG